MYFLQIHSLHLPPAPPHMPVTVANRVCYLVSQLWGRLLPLPVLGFGIYLSDL